MRRVLIALFSLIIFANLGLLVFRFLTIERKLEKYQVPTEMVPTIEHREPHIRIAIVLDDLGVKTPVYHLLNDVAFKLNLAVIPGLKNSRELVKELASNQRYELLLHMPMEPLRRHLDMESGSHFSRQNYPFRIMHDDSKRNVRKTLNQAFDAIDGYGVVKGMNNHMGSWVTSSANMMTVIVDWARKEHLYFLDSLTSRYSVAYEEARKQRVPAAYNEIFLDGMDSEEYIVGQLEKLVVKAKENGQAIAIGHMTRQYTLPVLVREMPRLVASENVEFVWVSELINTQ